MKNLAVMVKNRKELTQFAEQWVALSPKTKKVVASAKTPKLALAQAQKKGELDPICGQLLTQGFRLVYEEPRLGAHDMKINFIHPSSAGGILIEVMEPAQ